MISFEKVAALVAVALLLRWGYGVVHSLFFSPLRNIPGPLLLQLIPFYDRLVLIAGKLPWLERKYHAQFGAVYRKGWNMVQVASEEALREIYSTHAYRKSDVYLFFQGDVQTIFNTTNRDFHCRRKRIMAPAFTTKKIEALHPVILSQGVHVLVSVLEKNVNQCVNMHTLFGCFSLDMIGVLGFGQSFNTLTNGPHIVETWYRKQLIRMFFNILIPGLKRVYNPYSERLHAFTQEAVDRVREHDTPSIMASLIKACDPETGDKLSDQEINAEALLQIFAGSDSTASVMTWSLYHILKHPRVYEKIVGELTGHKQSTCFLDAAIRETMRVIPPIAGSLERVVPSGGRTIDGYFLPGGTVVGVNTLTLHTMPSIWGPDALEYRPERWLDGSIPKDIYAFSPFSVGPRACIGRELAMAEIRLTLTHLLHRFHFTLTPDSQRLTPFSTFFTHPKEKQLLVTISRRNI